MSSTIYHLSTVYILQQALSLKPDVHDAASTRTLLHQIAKGPAEWEAT
jgi:hypothetical protein